MLLEDFVYCGDSLSNHDCIIGSLVTSNEQSIAGGSEITQTNVKNFATSQNSTLNVSYDTPLTATFDIFKNPCAGENYTFSDIEISYFMRWLNQKVPQKLQPIYDDTSYPGLYFIGSFTTINLIYINGSVIGFTLTFTTDSPWAYSDEMYSFSDVTAFKIFDLSDEIGKTYPYKFDITIKEAGDFRLINGDEDGSNPNYSVRINNCVADEILSFDCKNKIVVSSLGTTTHSQLYNDFNFVFPYFINTFTERKNFFTTSLTCDVEIKYSPIRKVGFIV